jgi:predicted small metal-binding protein
MHSGTSVKDLHEDKTDKIQNVPCMSFSCRDIGIDCSFEVKGTKEHKLMKKFIDHAESSHNMAVLPPELILKFKNAIRK